METHRNPGLKGSTAPLTRRVIGGLSAVGNYPAASLQYSRPPPASLQRLGICLHGRCQLLAKSAEHFIPAFFFGFGRELRPWLGLCFGLTSASPREVSRRQGSARRDAVKGSPEARASTRTACKSERPAGLLFLRNDRMTVAWSWGASVCSIRSGFNFKLPGVVEKLLKSALKASLHRVVTVSGFGRQEVTNLKTSQTSDH